MKEHSRTARISDGRSDAVPLQGCVGSPYEPNFLQTLWLKSYQEHEGDLLTQVRSLFT